MVNHRLVRLAWTCYLFEDFEPLDVAFVCLIFDKVSTSSVERFVARITFFPLALKAEIAVC